MTEPAVRCVGLTKSYGPKSAIGPFDFAVQVGECLGIVGPNGAGKTTLFRMLCGLVPASSGGAYIAGEQVARNRLPKGMAAMIEEPRFYEWLTGRENLLVAADGLRDTSGIDPLLADVGLDGAGNVRVRAYSQGMRQRLGIARVLLRKRPIILFDEATNGLDPLGIMWFRNLVAKLHADGVTVILSSHMLHEVQIMCDKYLMIVEGSVASSGRTKDLRSSSLEDEFLRLESLGKSKPHD